MIDCLWGVCDKTHELDELVITLIELLLNSDRGLLHLAPGTFHEAVEIIHVIFETFSGGNEWLICMLSFSNGYRRFVVSCANVVMMQFAVFANVCHNT